MSESLTQWLMSEAPASRRQAVLGNVYRGFLAIVSNPAALAGLFIVAVLILMAIFAPMLAGGISPIEQNLASRLAPPSADHWFGTDELGRDIYARTLYGARVTLTIVMLVSVVVAPVGLAVGTLAGYLGGWIDAVLMRITDIFLAFPRLVLALAFAAALGPGIENAVIAISLTAWPPYARIARSETVTIAKSDFILAVVMQGASTWRVLFKHIVPLCLSSVIVRLTLDMAGIILTAAGLGFLGLGAQPPTASWGAMLNDGRAFVLVAPIGLSDWFPVQATTRAPVTATVTPAPLPVPPPTEAYLTQGRALHDAEAMLLVDDSEAELCELGRLLHQRVRADYEVHVTGGKLGADVLGGAAAVGRDVSGALFGRGGSAFITVGMLVSVFGALNSQMMSGSRILLAVGQRRELPAWRLLGAINPSFQTPINSLIFQGLISIVFVLFGTFNSLSDLVIDIARWRDSAGTTRR